MLSGDSTSSNGTSPFANSTMANSYQQTAKSREKGKRRSWLRNIRYPRRQDINVSPLSVVNRQKESSSSQRSIRNDQIPGPIDELLIRLVHLQPRSISRDKIQCQLTTQNLVSNSYEALSYEWGPISPELLINMDGVDIPVRENLWWALHYLQLDDQPRILWIDALCINQTDTEERNYQVSRMDYIYHSASRCIAWIGKAEIRPDLEADDCKLAMEFITRVSIHEDETKLPITLSSQERREHDSLESLCRRKYWTRLWIIQEVVLSKSVQVQCGSHSVPWTSLRYIFHNLKAYVHASYQFSITCSA
ncbi:HET-domain-containing protein, partial [Cadophora sp. DSE1049]